MGKLQKDEAFYKKLWSLMVPIVLQNLMLAMVAVADAFMLGGMDQNYMSAVSLATQIQFIQNMFLAAATASLGILGAQYWGKGDKKTLDEIFCMALRLCGLVSAIFFVGCVFFGRYLMLLFTNEEVLINYGISYLKIAGFSYLITGISQCYLVIMKTSEHAKTTAVISSMTVCVNIILNAIFIFGGFGIALMGVRGAALATLIARIIELCCSVLISYKPNYLHPSMRDLLRRNKQLSKDFWKCGLPLLGACLFWGIGFTSYSSFMGHLGTDAAAANSVFSFPVFHPWRSPLPLFCSSLCRHAEKKTSRQVCRTAGLQKDHLRTKDMQSVHCFIVGSDSWVPTWMRSSEQ